MNVIVGQAIIGGPMKNGQHEDIHLNNLRVEYGVHTFFISNIGIK